jgi:hypothetical protein
MFRQMGQRNHVTAAGGVALFLCISLLSTRVSGQTADDFMNIFGGIMQNAIIQAAQFEWKKLSPGEYSCVDETLRGRNSSIEALAQRGVMPFDPRISDIRLTCKKARSPEIIPVPTNIQANPYVVDGLQLGGKVTFGSPEYSEYQCGPSEQFAGFTWCRRKRQEGPVSITTSILHAQDGTSVYVNRSIEPATWDPGEIEKNISSFETKYGEKARIIKMPSRPGLPDALIASWGKVQLEPLDAESIAVLASGASPKKGLLVDFLGDLQRSAKLGIPVYRLSGGAGFVWSASDLKRGGHLRLLAIDLSAVTPVQGPEQTPPQIPPPAAPPVASGPEHVDVSKLSGPQLLDVMQKTCGLNSPPDPSPLCTDTCRLRTESGAVFRKPCTPEVKSQLSICSDAVYEAVTWDCTPIDQEEQQRKREALPKRPPQTPPGSVATAPPPSVPTRDEAPRTNDPIAIFFLLVLILLGLAFYLLPSIVAFFRRHPNRRVILVINVAAGVTVFGWLLSLVWACRAIHKSPLTKEGKGSDGGESGLNIFANDAQKVVVTQASDKARQLKELAGLLEKGLISNTEFANLKAGVIKGA